MSEKKNIRMKTRFLLLVFVSALNFVKVAPQQPPLIIPAGKPTIIPVPKKNYTFSVNNQDQTATKGTRTMTPPQTTHFFSEGDVAGLSFFVNHNIEQGLALNSIACGYTDSKGNLWFGTLGGGVSRYDGKSFTNFTTAHGLANNIVYSIVEDKTGNFWFGTSGGGVSRYDGKSFTSITTAQGLANNTVWSIIQDKKGDLWFGTLGGGVSRYDGKSFTNFTTTQGLAHNKIRSIMEDRSGILWLATDGGGVSRYDGKSFTNFTTAHGLANNIVYSIAEDKNNNIWFGTLGGGVSRYHRNSFTNFTTVHGLANNIVYSIAEDKTGNLWFATDGGGVSRYDGTGFTNYTKEHGLANNSVWSITQDKTGHLWFGTSGGGVSRFVGKSVTSFTRDQGLANNIVYSIAEDKKANIWFGTLEGGVSRYDGRSLTNFSTAQGMANNTIRCITEDRNGNIWFGTDGGGVSRFDGKSFANYTKEQGISNNIVFSITEDKKGNIWFGTDGGGVSRFDGKSFTNFTTVQGLANNNIWSALEDKNGNLWFATYGGGVSRFDGKSFTNFTTAGGLGNNDVWNIVEDKKGNIWFGTSGGGVSRYDGKSFLNISTSQGLADDKVYDIIIDSRENIFIGTSLGFSVLKEFKSIAPGEKSIPAVNALANEEVKKYLPVFEIYNKHTGYPIKDININAMYCDSKGIIWAGGGDNKLIRFDYNAILKSTEPPKVFIQAVRIQDQPVSWFNLMKRKNKQDSLVDSLAILNEEALLFGKSLSDTGRDLMREKYSSIKFKSITPFYAIPENLVLSYSYNNVTFDFVAIEPARHFLVRYQYMLEGYDKNWSPVTGNTSATFGNIAEGTYTFKVKARSPDGIWSQPISYTFKVLPPWYRTWWAYLLFAILFVSIVWVFIHYRSSSLRKEKQLLEEKVTQRTNQLSQSLQELRATQEQLIQSEKMASLGELTAGIAHEMQNPLNFVNNFSEVSNELLDEMNEELNKGKIIEAKAIARDVKKNMEKILHHGKRVDGIVKGMLQHTRSGSGIKEPTDINKLADEYLRLAYHGLRAKDKEFNAAILTKFDETIGNVNIIPQDIGRVLLNLYTNAFYAVAEKNRQIIPGYEPAISVSTNKIENGVEICVKDNGSGIPQKVMDKIFQPFFTTKPTGEGTGLGLSISYDIIKGHGGEIKVKSKEGEGTEFIVQLV